MYLFLSLVTSPLGESKYSVDNRIDYCGLLELTRDFHLRKIAAIEGEKRCLNVINPALEHSESRIIVMCSGEKWELPIIRERSYIHGISSNFISTNNTVSLDGEAPRSPFRILAATVGIPTPFTGGGFSARMCAHSTMAMSMFYLRSMYQRGTFPLESYQRLAIALYSTFFELDQGEGYMERIDRKRLLLE